MFFSKMLIPTLKEAPSDADIVSVKLMVRSGMIRKLASGFYELLPLGLKVLRKVENIIRQEMNSAGGQEVIFPLVFPKALWLETDRWNAYGKELFKLKDRKDAEFCLAPTAEEVVTDLIRKDIKSYKQLPVMLYQFGTKFRDEIRPRFGVMRSREFLMKDAYSFHADEADLEKYYKTMFDAYTNICIKCGFQFRAVEAASGVIGGSFSHEFMVLTDTGEEEMTWCSCGYGANSAKTECLKIEQSKEEPLPSEEIFTTDVCAIEDVAKLLNLSPKKFIKTMIYIADKKPVAVLVRGDYEINEIKLQTLLGADGMLLADEQTVISVTNAPIGFAGPAGLKNIKIIADLSVAELSNALTGANKKDYHLKNVNFKRDYNADIVADIRKVKRGDTCPRCKKEELKFSRGIEIGHTFKLGDKYSKSMNASYLDANGKEKFIIMGCYGIGVTRILAAIIEQSHDDDGIIWTNNIAPFEVVIVPLNYADEKTKETTEKIYKELSSKGLDVLIDDRDERAGIKFKDADLIGIPYRITISEKNLANGNVELKARRDGKDDAVRLFKPEGVVIELLKIFKK
ncbi:proline--tRNA ligase [Endomicrobiia bacterium]|uniref:Proline--tRNA ligase n=1 Tax=Endomicrobium trichonymphae TaxID=1408204 RepID=SYP_ENDTX|nr:proline--tRNA ligase [Candidatus Endomicrobium trichonymphae]B1H063.1 RecName: Full=Proline--tRNA ligase; AltName: Full=Prolyl-tRNA synthetase; Short=ProRS [Candidatus Endomicrobium trichonymphae]GHT03873.1 proline--tRNA ligase [Endomicrobiia bacterium]BAG13895.1 prolyl-tRNA synthetase [Candidatus Endomicrobium trichonymphae]BAV59026.1 prolyl-tRNA synthetase [Candidatus Endomicrobium trichonymphae]GHT09084.1 proline--tRNA ligase [Endomicrobiia bacterium]GHT11176.1 proline--tRNA ligase [End